MTNTSTFIVATYQADGAFQSNETINTDSLESSHVEHFEEKLAQLSGDLELPFEDRLPGDSAFIEYRIGSDLNGAYVLYYFHDEVIFSSLLLSGTDEVTETELMQVFRFLLLDTHDQDEPTEEDIEEVLSTNEFDFPAIDERPAVFEVRLSDREDESKACEHVTKMNRHLAHAFFALQRSD